MWNEIKEVVGEFETAVLSITDSHGYPFSFRCTPKIDEVKQGWCLSLNELLPLQDGAAGLLFHSLDENLWNLKSVVIRGEIQEVDEGWFFQPSKLILGQGMNGLWGEFQAMQNCRQTAQTYLEKRGLARPKIDWHGFKAIWSEVDKQK